MQEIIFVFFIMKLKFGIFLEMNKNVEDVSKKEKERKLVFLKFLLEQKIPSH